MDRHTDRGAMRSKRVRSYILQHCSSSTTTSVRSALYRQLNHRPARGAEAGSARNILANLQLYPKILHIKPKPPSYIQTRSNLTAQNCLPFDVCFQWFVALLRWNCCMTSAHAPTRTLYSSTYIRLVSYDTYAPGTIPGNKPGTSYAISYK